MSLNESDWPWAEQKCLAALHDQPELVRATAITGLGHLARLHQTITKEVVVPALENLKGDPHLGGIAEDALDDIAMFASGPRIF
jgi:hypothetical protein